MAAIAQIFIDAFSIDETADSAENKSTLEPTQQLPRLLHRVKSRSGGQGVKQGPCRTRGACSSGNRWTASAETEAIGTASSFAGACRYLEAAPR
jgi:hypothetical protein